MSPEIDSMSFARTVAGLSILSAASLVASCAAPDVRPSSAFQEFLDEADRAQVAFQQGDPGPYKALWSHGADVTLAGGFGGSFEQGWEGVSKRLEWASSQFRGGRNSIKRVSSDSSGDIGYLVQTEHLEFTSASQGTAVERDYRVTMLFRRENGAWRIIHRHADTQNLKLAPQ